MTPQQLLLRVVLLGSAVFALMLGILFGLPDGNDFALITLKKHDRLDAAPARKIVIVGGSNLAFGIDSPTIEKELDIYVVNMGMNAYLGLRFLLDEVAPSLRPGDLVLLSPEIEIFHVQREFDGIEGSGKDLLMMTKVRPKSFDYVKNWPQRKRLISAFPEVVNLKTQRIIKDFVDNFRGQTILPQDAMIKRIETVGAFNDHGDLVSHIGVKWEFGFTRPLELSALPYDEKVVPFLRQYVEELQKKGVKLVVTPCPVPTQYYEKHKAAYTRVYDALKRELGPSILSSPERVVFPESCFFDEIHHLNGDCRLIRTARIVADLRPHTHEVMDAALVPGR